PKDAGGREHAAQALANPQEYERALLAALRARGYARASVSVGNPIFEETMATVPVIVHPGPQLRFGVVSFEGANSIPVDQLRAEAGLEEGAPYRADAGGRARRRRGGR